MKSLLQQLKDAVDMKPEDFLGKEEEKIIINCKCDE